MKNSKVAIYLVMIGLAILAKDVFAEPNDISSVDFSKVRKHQFAAFVENICWPSNETIESKRIPKTKIPEETDKFSVMLKEVLNPAYLPPTEVVDANVIAVENFRNKNDYLLLKYKCKGYDVQIQDGKALWILFSPHRSTDLDKMTLPEYVKFLALSTLDIPEQDENHKDMSIGASALDIGNSKIGVIFYEASFPPPQYWYSYMRWWSDGQDVLFSIGKSSFNGVDLSKRAGPPPNMKAPRKFKY